MMSDYSLLKDLDLKTDQFDYQLLIGIVFYVSVLMTVMALYLSQYKSALLSNRRTSL